MRGSHPVRWEPAITSRLSLPYSALWTWYVPPMTMPSGKLLRIFAVRLSEALRQTRLQWMRLMVLESQARGPRLRRLKSLLRTWAKPMAKASRAAKRMVRSQKTRLSCARLREKHQTLKPCPMSH